jgi:hypothetical protein
MLMEDDQEHKNLTYQVGNLRTVLSCGTCCIMPVRSSVLYYSSKCPALVLPVLPFPFHTNGLLIGINTGCQAAMSVCTNVFD